MRLTCEFCNNEVELEGNMTCPHCGGVLTEAAKKERERLRILEEAEKARQAELEKERLKAEEKRLKAEAAESDNEKWGRILSSSLGFAPLEILRRLFSRITRDLGGFFKILGIIAVIVIIIIIYKVFFA